MKHRRAVSKASSVLIAAGLSISSAFAQTGQNPASGTTTTGQSLSVQIDSPIDGALVSAGALAVRGSAVLGPLPASNGSGGSGSSGTPAASASSPSGAIIYIVDVSGSTRRPFGSSSPTSGQGLDCNGDGVVDAGDDINGDGLNGEVLDCEIFGLKTLTQTLAPGLAVGVVALANTGTSLDMDPSADGIQLFTGPATDSDANGVADVLQALQTLRPSGLSNYDQALAAANAAFASRPAGERHVVAFVSDGASANTLSTGTGTPLAQAAAAGTQIYTVVTGAAHTCASGEDVSRVATATGGSCTAAPDPATLITQVAAIPPVGISSVTVAIDGGTSTNASLDLTGSWSSSVTVPSGGTHGITATALASDTSTVTARVAVTSGAAGTDTTPDAFRFVDVANASLNTLVLSAPVTITGIDAPTAVSVTGGQYSINSGPFTSTASTVVAGDKIRVSVQSSGSAGTTSSAVLAVGGVSDSFDVTTAGRSHSGGGVFDLELLAAMFAMVAIRRRRPSVRKA